MARWSTRGNENTVLAARQSDLTTENTTGASFVALPVSIEVDHVQEQEDFSDLASGAYGTFEPPAPGTKSGGTLKIAGRIECMMAAYAGVSNNPGGTGVLSPIMALIANALGSTAADASTDDKFWEGQHLTLNAYQASGINAIGSSTTVANVALFSDYAIGALAYWDPATPSTTPSFGFVKSTTDAVQDLATMFDPMAVAPTSGDVAYGTATASLTKDEPWPLTFHHLGTDAAFKYSYIGCVATRLMLDFGSGKTPTFEIDYVYTDRSRYSSGGTLSAPANFQAARPFLGKNGGRFLVNGTAACGFKDFKVEVNWTITPVECPNKSQGVSEFIRLLDTVAVTATVPLDSTDTITGTLDQYEAAYEAGASFSVGAYVGQAPGSTCALLLPSMALASSPTLVDSDGLLAHELSWRPLAYTGDGSATVPGNTPLRLAVA
tara:strand:+ start:1218 stop:2525 length:1308 start_codon:yes stop_codon:yes gene_type:complete